MAAGEVGAGASEYIGKDTVVLPDVGAHTTSRSRLVPSSLPEGISMYHRLLGRIF